MKIPKQTLLEKYNNLEVRSPSIQIESEGNEDLYNGLDAFAKIQTDRLITKKHFTKLYNSGNYDKMFAYIFVKLKELGIPPSFILRINILEMYHNEDSEGNPLENSIQGFSDWDEKYTPGDVLLWKLDEIKEDYDNGTIKDMYYWCDSYLVSPEWEDYDNVPVIRDAINATIKQAEEEEHIPNA